MAAASNSVIFVYQDRNCIVPRPVSHDAAVVLVRDYVVRYDQSIFEVRFMARFAHHLADHDQDVEITPPAWDEASNATRFNIVIAPKLEDPTVSSPASSLTINPEMTGLDKSTSGSQISPTVPLPVTNLDGAHICTLFLSPEETIQAVKTRIREQACIPIRKQTLYHGGITLQPHKRLSEYGIQDGSILRLCRQSGSHKQCSCGPGSRSEVNEEHELENVLAEIRYRKVLEKEREPEQWRAKKERQEEAEAQQELEFRRARLNMKGKEKGGGTDDTNTKVKKPPV